jgi:hypothetical protein
MSIDRCLTVTERQKAAQRDAIVTNFTSISEVETDASNMFKLPSRGVHTDGLSAGLSDKQSARVNTSMHPCYPAWYVCHVDVCTWRRSVAFVSLVSRSYDETCTKLMIGLLAVSLQLVVFFFCLFLAFSLPPSPTRLGRFS